MQRLLTPAVYGNYFRTRSGLYVSGSYIELVLTGACPAVPVELEYQIVKRGMCDQEIERKLGDGHIFSRGILCSTLIKTIEKQKKGRDGTLLNDGYLNLFYLATCIARVYWNPIADCWHLTAYSDRGSERGTDHRAFRPKS